MVSFRQESEVYWGKYAVSENYRNGSKSRFLLLEQDDEAEVVTFDEENIRVEYGSLIVHKSTGTSE